MFLGIRQRMGSMPNDFEEYMAYATHLRAEHERLRELLDRVEQQWLAQPKPGQGEQHLHQLIKSLQAVRTELEKHFEEEESDGCLEEAVSHHPHLSHEATRLEQEHPQLMQELVKLIERLRSASDSQASTNKLIRDFRHFTNKLLAHEAAENRILEEGFSAEG
jgi:iron-sulfur cluster repair protein YtfE (RIC family)